MNADPLSEKRTGRFYVPRDECFSEVKELTFSTKTLHSVLLILLPTLGRIIKDKDLPFSYFHDIDSLFSIGLDLPHSENMEQEKGFLSAIMPRLVRPIDDSDTNNNDSSPPRSILRFECPETINSLILSLFLSTLSTYTLLFSSSTFITFYISTSFAFSGDRFFWYRDEEFARQTVAGLNPNSIKLVTVIIITHIVNMLFLVLFITRAT